MDHYVKPSIVRLSHLSLCSNDTADQFFQLVVKILQNKIDYVKQPLRVNMP